MGHDLSPVTHIQNAELKGITRVINLKLVEVHLWFI
jgi:hypothetical protein